MKNIIILGRGDSLKKLTEFSEDIDTVILVNEFWDVPYCPKSYYKDNLVHNFLKDKKIILICSICCDLSKIDLFLNKYNVIAKYKTQFSKKIRIGTNNICKLLPEKIIEPYIYLEKNFGYTGSMGCAILYARIILKINNIFILGLDFYEKDYYLTNNYNYQCEINKSELIKKDWIKLFGYYKNTNFNIYTLANFRCELLNVNIL